MIKVNHTSQSVKALLGGLKAIELELMMKECLL